MTPANPVPDWLQIAVAWTSVLGSIGVVVAVAAFWVQWFRGREERKERKVELAALQRAEDDRIAAQARKIVPEVASSALFGDDIWIAHIQNASTGAIGQLKVVVEAYDGDNNDVADGIRKATGELDIGSGLQRLISDASRGGLSGALGSSPISAILGQQIPGQNQLGDMLAQQVTPEVSRRMRQAMMGQLAKDWPPSLGPGGEAAVAYRATRPGLHMHIAIGFEDEAGYEWHRVNTDQPIRVKVD